MVRISTYGSWDQFSAWWWNLIRKQSEVSPAMRAKVEELVAGATSPAAKVAAIYRFVTTDVRYTAWEFGVHGYKPYATPVIFERRHGDCKDKSLLLNAMLSTVGIDAYPVLVYADEHRSTDDLSLPMVGHFNHCISYLPEQPGLPAMFLDGTATYHPVDTLPAMDRGAKVLVVKSGAGEVRDIPWTDPEQNVDDEAVTVDLDAGGSARLEVVHRPRQIHAVGVRAELGNEPERRAEKLEREYSGKLGKVAVESVETSDLLDLSRPVEVVVDMTVVDFAGRQGDGIILKSCLEPDGLTKLSAKPTRDYALLLGTPSSTHTVVRYRLPDGFAPVELPEPIEVERSFGSYRLHFEFRDGELRVERRRSFATPRIEPAEYPAFRDFAATVDRGDSQVVVVKPQGGGR